MLCVGTCTLFVCTLMILTWFRFFRGIEIDGRFLGGQMEKLNNRTIAKLHNCMNCIVCVNCIDRVDCTNYINCMNCTICNFQRITTETFQRNKIKCN